MNRSTRSDVSERKRLEEDLRESEGKYRSLYQEFRGILEAIPDALLLLSRDLKVIWANEVAAANMHVSLDRFIGRHCYEVRHGWSEPCPMCPVKTCYGSHKPQIAVTSTPDGRIWELHAFPVFDDSGEVIGVIEVARNITERKQAENNLKESESRYRTIFENTGTGMVIVEEDTTISLANMEFEKLTGYPRGEIEGKKSWTEFVVKEDLEKMLIRHRLRRVDQDAAEKTYEFRLADAQGNIKNVFLTIEMIPGTQKSVASFLDITERKQSEEALRESEIRYQSIFENTGTVMLIVEEDMTISYANAEFESLTGYTRQEIEGKKKWTEFVEKSDMERMVEQHRLRRADRSHALKGYEFRLVQRDGRLRDIFLTVDIIPGTQKSVASLVDITQRKQAERGLQESEEKYSAVVKQATDGVVIIQDNRIQFANEALASILGYRPDEMENRPYVDFVAPESRAMVVARGNARLAGKDVPQIYQARFLRKDGTTIDVELSASVIQYRGKPTEVGLIRNITERKRLEEERHRLEERLKRVEKMEALGTLAGGVAHDMNNVLGVLVGYSELLLKALPEGSPLRRHALNILQSGQRGAAIIQDLLTLARRGVAVSEVVNLNPLVLDYLRTPEYEKLKMYHPHVTIKTVLEEDLLNIKGSPVHLGKTIMNLVSNASEAIIGQGEVTIRTENRYLDKPIRGYDDVKEGDYVVLTVSDNGEGISPVDLGKIFEPFYTKKVMGRSGTGLGLAVVWGTVKDHNGYIDLQSERGRGSSFALYFPITREAQAPSQREVSPALYMGRGESILVVDDVEGQRELAVSMLTILDYKAHAVSSGEEAVAYLKSNQVDLLVLDMIMDPGIDGLETYRQISEIKPRHKAIIVSGFAETDRVKMAQHLGAGAYVRKPYVVEKIGMAIREELDKS